MSTPTPVPTHVVPACSALRKDPSAVLKEPEGVYESDSDCESDSGIDNLMYLLDGPAEESQKKVKHSQTSVTTNKSSDPPQSVVDPPQRVADVSEITESNHREKAPNTVKIENFDSRDGIWIQFRDGTAFGKYPTIVVPSNMCQYEQVLAILYTKNSDKEVQVPKFLHNAQVSDHVKMQATHPVSANKYWVKPSSLSEGRIIFKKKTWALGKKIKAFVSSGAVKFHFILVPFHNGKLRYDKAESTPDFEVRSKEQQNVTRARQGLINTVPRPRKRRRTAESEAKRIALESVRSDIASQHKENAKKTRMKKDNDARLLHILELTSYSNEPEVVAMHQSVQRHLALQEKREASSHNMF